jgi:hypothetical protein
LLSFPRLTIWRRLQQSMVRRIFLSSATGQKEGKITVNAFRTALNIPASDLDEKTAVVAGGTSGYVWGTNGTDGVIRMNVSMAWTKDASNGFVTLAVGDVDCGTF